VEAKSPDRAKQVSSQLHAFSFEPIEDEEDSQAGLLLLSRNPAATRAKQAAARTEQTQHSAPGVISRPPVIELVVPCIEISSSLWLFWYSTTQPTPRSWFLAAFACVSLLFFLRDGTRIWGWGLEILPKGLRVKRRFRWSMIPWDQIRAVESVPAPAWGRNQEAIVLKLASNRPERLGIFNPKFVRIVCDRLRDEIALRRNQ
jgi:hypothetical protein